MRPRPPADTPAVGAVGWPAGPGKDLISERCFFFPLKTPGALTSGQQRRSLHWASPKGGGQCTRDGRIAHRSRAWLKAQVIMGGPPASLKGPRVAPAISPGAGRARTDKAPGRVPSLTTSQREMAEWHGVFPARFLARRRTLREWPQSRFLTEEQEAGCTRFSVRVAFCLP